MTTRVLLARPDHLGDVVLALPAARLLKATIPGARVDALVTASLAPVALRCPGIDEVVPVPYPAPTADDEPAGWAEVVAAIAPEIGGRYDAALVPRIDDPWSGSVLAAAEVPIRLGYDHPRTARFLTHRLLVPDRRHVTQLACDLVVPVVAALGVDAGPAVEPTTEPWLAATSADRAEASACLGRAGIDPSSAYVVLHPGAGWPIKEWRPARWGEVARHIAGRHGLPVVVTGVSAERGLVLAVVGASGGAARGLAGALTLGGLLGLLVGATLVVGVDSGPLQAAAAVGAPVVALFGPADAAEFAPWSPAGRLAIVRVDLPCSPCRALDAPPCGAARLPACVEAVSVEMVTNAIDRLVRARPDQPPSALIGRSTGVGG